MSAREAGRGQPHRGGGEGKVSRRAGRPAAYLPPREPLFASPLPRGFCQTGAAALAPSPPPPRNAPPRPRKALRARAWPLPPPAAPGPGRCRGGRRAPAAAAATSPVPAAPAGALRGELAPGLPARLL